MKKKYFTVYTNGFSYSYIEDAGAFRRVKYHSHKPKDRSYKMIEGLKRSKIKEFYRKEYTSY